MVMAWLEQIRRRQEGQVTEQRRIHPVVINVDLVDNLSEVWEVFVDGLSKSVLS